MSQFNNVAVVKKANVYFDGKCVSHTVQFADGGKKTIGVILPLLDLLLEKTRETLLLSGILAEQEPLIVSALAERGYASPEIEHSGEWISVIVNKV